MPTYFRRGESMAENAAARLSGPQDADSAFATEPGAEGKAEARTPDAL